MDYVNHSTCRYRLPSPSALGRVGTVLIVLGATVNGTFIATTTDGVVATFHIVHGRIVLVTRSLVGAGEARVFTVATASVGPAVAPGERHRVDQGVVAVGTLTSVDRGIGLVFGVVGTMEASCFGRHVFETVLVGGVEMDFEVVPCLVGFRFVFPITEVLLEHTRILEDLLEGTDECRVGDGVVAFRGDDDGGGSAHPERIESVTRFKGSTQTFEVLAHNVGCQLDVLGVEMGDDVAGREIGKAIHRVSERLDVLWFDSRNQLSFESLVELIVGVELLEGMRVGIFGFRDGASGSILGQDGLGSGMDGSDKVLACQGLVGSVGQHEDDMAMLSASAQRIDGVSVGKELFLDVLERMDGRLSGHTRQQRMRKVEGDRIVEVGHGGDGRVLGDVALAVVLR